MYNPAHFDESSPEALHALIAAYPLGALVTHGKSGLDANHLPFELRTEQGDLGVLHAHVARPNPCGATCPTGMRSWWSFASPTRTSVRIGTRPHTSSTSRYRRGTTSWR